MTAITLKQIENIAKEICPSSKIGIVIDDYDEYGADVYVRISGEIADLIIKDTMAYDFYCSIHSRTKLTKETVKLINHDGEEWETNHDINFDLKGNYREIESYDLDEIKEWILDHKKYLKASSDNFQRIEQIYYGDSQGDNEWLSTFSYDKFIVCDEDFHTEPEIKEVRKTKLEVETFRLSPEDISFYF